jgi:hypothetical protein
MQKAKHTSVDPINGKAAPLSFCPSLDRQGSYRRTSMKMSSSTFILLFSLVLIRNKNENPISRAYVFEAKKIVKTCCQVLNHART